jgi:hypothetical protein
MITIERESSIAIENYLALIGRAQEALELHQKSSDVDLLN